MWETAESVAFSGFTVCRRFLHTHVIWRIACFFYGNQGWNTLFTLLRLERGPICILLKQLLASGLLIWHASICECCGAASVHFMLRRKILLNLAGVAPKTDPPAGALYAHLCCLNLQWRTFIFLSVLFITDFSEQITGKKWQIISIIFWRFNKIQTS